MQVEKRVWRVKEFGGGGGDLCIHRRAKDFGGGETLFFSTLKKLLDIKFPDFLTQSND